jgi:hypothetical protein
MPQGSLSRSQRDTSHAQLRAKSVSQRMHVEYPTTVIAFRNPCRFQVPVENS